MRSLIGRIVFQMMIYSHIRLKNIYCVNANVGLTHTLIRHSRESDSPINQTAIHSRITDYITGTLQLAALDGREPCFNSLNMF